MAARVPVIATSVGGVSDLLGENTERMDGFTLCERGISVPSNDDVAFANGLLYLAKNEKLRFDLAEKGYQFAVGNYGKERLVSDIKSLYARMLEE
jgi:glycosyltransferase involved in cell wall biosynthesis